MPHYESSGDFVVQDNNVVIKLTTMENNTYINHSKFIEFIDELAIQFTEKEFGEETYAYSNEVGKEDVLMYQEDAYNYYNQKYDEIETMANKIMGLYTDNEKPTHTRIITEYISLTHSFACVFTLSSVKYSIFFHNLIFGKYTFNILIIKI